MFVLRESAGQKRKDVPGFLELQESLVTQFSDLDLIQRPETCTIGKLDNCWTSNYVEVLRDNAFKQVRMQRECSSCAVRRFRMLAFSVILKYVHIFSNAHKRTCMSCSAYGNYSFFTDFSEQTNLLSVDVCSAMMENTLLFALWLWL